MGKPRPSEYFQNVHFDFGGLAWSGRFPRVASTFVSAFRWRTRSTFAKTTRARPRVFEKRGLAFQAARPARFWLVTAFRPAARRGVLCGLAMRLHRVRIVHFSLVVDKTQAGRFVAPRLMSLHQMTKRELRAVAHVLLEMAALGAPAGDCLRWGTCVGLAESGVRADCLRRLVRGGATRFASRWAPWSRKRAAPTRRSAPRS